MVDIDRLLNQDPNKLPYFIVQPGTGAEIPVRFVPLVKADAVKLKSAVWSGAVFRDVWLAWIGNEKTLKLVSASRADRQIQGIVHLGKIRQPGGFLRDSLLEAAPFNQRTQSQPQYHAVGRVLVTRLVVESFRQDGRGKVLVRSRPGVVEFYKKLGFRELPRASGYFILDTVEAISLLERSLRL